MSFVTLSISTVQVGWVLRSCRLGGAYIDSVERSAQTNTDINKADPQETNISLIGSVIWLINGENVRDISMRSIAYIMRSTQRPVTVTLLLPTYISKTKLSFVEILRDPRKHSWIREFLSLCSKQKQLEIGILLSAMLACIHNEKLAEAKTSDIYSNTYLRVRYDKFLSRGLHSGLMNEFIIEELHHLTTVLAQGFGSEFIRSEHCDRMIGCMYRTLEYRDLSIVDCLKDEVCMAHFYHYVNQPGNRIRCHDYLLLTYRLIEEYNSGDSEEVLEGIFRMTSMFPKSDSWMMRSIVKELPFREALAQLRNLIIERLQQEINKFKLSVSYDRYLAITTNTSFPGTYVSVSNSLDFPRHISRHKFSRKKENIDNCTESDQILWIVVFDTGRLIKGEKSIIKEILPIVVTDDEVLKPSQNLPASSIATISQYIVPYHEYFAITDNSNQCAIHPHSFLRSVQCNISQQDVLYGAVLTYYRPVICSQGMTSQELEFDTHNSDIKLDYKPLLNRNLNANLQFIPQNLLNILEKTWSPAKASEKSSVTYYSESEVEYVINLINTNDLNVLTAQGIAVLSTSEVHTISIRRALAEIAYKISSDDQNKDAIDIIDILSSSIVDAALNEYSSSTMNDIIRHYLFPNTIATLIVALLLENQIIISSSSSSTILSILCSWLKYAIQPLKYCHVYCPTVPRKILSDLLSCPTPYLLGYYGDIQNILSDLIDNEVDSQTTPILHVDVDSGTFKWIKGLNVGEEYTTTISSLLDNILENDKMQIRHDSFHTTNSDSISQHSIFNHTINRYSQRDVTTVCREFVQCFTRPIIFCCWLWPTNDSNVKGENEILILIHEEVYTIFITSESNVSKGSTQYQFKITENIVLRFLRTQHMSNYLESIFG